MPLFPPQFVAHQYQSGIDHLRSGYQAAMRSLDQDRLRAELAYEEYVASGQDDREYDEDGCLIQSTAFMLKSEEYEAGYAVKAVREAFIISAFHYWEKWARGWTALKWPKDQYRNLRDKSPHPVSSELNALNHLTNLLKHGNAHHAQKLAALRTDHFWRSPMCFIHNREVSWAVGISDAHVEEAFSIVRASGPQYYSK